jgi:hypothetical protein
VIGAGLMATPLVTSLFDRTSAADRLASAVRPAMTATALDAGKTDLASVQKAYGELKDELIPSMAATVHVPSAQLVSDVQAQYPDVRAGMAGFDTAVVNAQRILDTLVANRQRYESADSIPMHGFPLTATPWTFVAVGAVFVLLGLLSLLRPIAGLAALLVVALGVAVVPLVAAVPGKMSDTNALVGALKGTLSRQAATTARAQYTTFATMVVEFDTKVLPQFAQQAHMSDAEVAGFVAQHAPLLASGAPDVPRILAKFSALTTALVAQVDNYGPTAEIPFAWLSWLLVIPGFLLAALAAVSLATAPRLTPAPVTATAGGGG